MILGYNMLNIKISFFLYQYFNTENTHEITSYVGLLDKFKLLGKKCQIICIFQIDILLGMNCPILTNLSKNMKVIHRKHNISFHWIDAVVDIMNSFNSSML